jgi:TolB-like protein
MSQTRRLAAILAADVAGYSRLIGTDEGGTLRRLRAIRDELVDPTIATHHGRLVKTTGDGLLVEFSSVVDALRCASEIQAGMSERNASMAHNERIEFRMGLNVGDVVVEDGDIFGDGVNVAARLEGLAEPGEICVSARVQEDAAGKLELTFEDMGEQHLKNITRPVRVYRVPNAKPTTAKRPLPLPDKPSLAVLPFQNMSGDAEQEYFVDGMVEEITTAISRLPWLFVIARNSSFAYKGKSPDVRQVGRELGVSYVLGGSVRKAANRVRITGQLIDTNTGAHIWADRFDGSLDNIFELQDQVASSVVGAIEPKLRQSEIERATRKPTESLDAYDLYLRALAQFRKLTEQGSREAIVLLQRALIIDPNYAPAAGMIGWCRNLRRVQGWAAGSGPEIAETVRLARLAIEIGREDPDALCMAAIALSNFAHEPATAGSIVDRALALNPNSALAWSLRGWVAAGNAQPGTAIEAFERAMRLSPFDPIGFLFTAGLALASLLAGLYQDANRWADVSLREQPRYLLAIRVKVVSCAELGRMDEARHWLGRMLDINPGSTIAEYRKLAAGYFRLPETFDIFLEGLRKAGLPEE